MFSTLVKTPGQQQRLSVPSQRWERITVWKMDQINDDLHVNKTGTNGHRQQRDAMTAGSRGERSGLGAGLQLQPVGEK